VHGAAGGVGLTAVEIGKALGARVIATAGGPDKCAITSAHGADHVIDYKSEDIRERVKALVGGVDVVYDPVGGAVFEASLKVVNWNARILVIGFAGGPVPQIPANILLVKNVAAMGFYFGSWRQHRPDVVARAFSSLDAMVQAGQLKPLVSHRLPLADFRAALELIQSRQSTGKVVLLTGAAY
jgi:NADPH2:quinone reductase